MEIGVNTTGETGSLARPFQCTICNKSFVHESSLEEHVLNKHVDDKEFQCSACFETKQLVKSFATQHILNKHIKRVHGPPRFKCHVCFKTFIDTSNFAAHKRSHSQADSKRHTCTLCSKSFRFKNILLEHLFNVHKQRRDDVSYFKCEICSREFFRRSELELHVIRQHVVDKPFECLVCSKTFIDQPSLEKHMKRHDSQNKYSCDVCFKEFAQKRSLATHLGVNHKHFFYCDKKCSRSFKNKPDFEEHISDSKQELKCFICQELINSECNFKIHTDSHGKEIKTETKDIKIENGAKLVEMFTPKSTEELNLGNFHCELCSKIFDREKYFKAHRSLVHPNAGWRCNFNECSKTFKSYNRYRLHKMEHAETKEFVCNICQKSFYHPDSLKDHQQVHLREKKYKCEICPKSFTVPSGLRTHSANNHGGFKPFKCPVVNCGTFRANNYQLNIHLISHQTDKSFKCELCATFKAFKSPGHLAIHQRRVHSETKKNEAHKSRENMKYMKYFDAFIFICSSNSCSFESHEEKDMALHYNQQHQLPKVVIMGNSSLSSQPPFVSRKFETNRMIQKR